LTPDGLLADFTDANAHTTGFAYDRFDRLATTTYPDGSTEAVLLYDADSNVLQRTNRAGQPFIFAYDTLNRVKTKTPPSPAAVVSYGYDLAGRPTSVSDTSAAIAAVVPPSPATSVLYATNFGYDTVNRPTAVTWNPAPTAAAPTAGGVTFNHAYNRANQRVGQTVTDNNWLNYPAATPSTVSYSADALNRYIAVGAVIPTYDGNSNLTFDGTFTFGNDAENRLTSASGAGNTASYTYDAQGRRKTKTVNGTMTVFVTDAGNREVLEYDGASGAIQRWYAYGLGSNDVLNQSNVAAGTRAALIPDIQGSVIASLDSATATLTKIGYLPYGKSAGATAPFGYTGQRIDPETNGLYYCRARHYSPAWGRFMQPDPIGTGGGINLYAYVNNDPLNLIDPFGLSPDSLSTTGGFTLALPGVRAAGDILSGTTLGPLAVATVIASVGLALSSTSTADRVQDEVQYVVRGGISSPTTLQRGVDELTPLRLPGVYGISSSTGVNMSVSQIAEIANYPHENLTYTTTQELSGIGYQVQPTPTGNLLHASILLPPGQSSLTNEQAATLSGLFAPNRVLNPNFTSGR
jgi:RHS repeat-associated protein